MKPISLWTDAELEEFSVTAGDSMAGEVLRLRGENRAVFENDDHEKAALRARTEKAEAAAVQTREDWEYMRREKEKVETELAESQHGYGQQMATVQNGIRANRALLDRAEKAEAEVEHWKDLRGRSLAHAKDYRERAEQVEAELSWRRGYHDCVEAQHLLDQTRRELARCRPVVDAALALASLPWGTPIGDTIPALAVLARTVNAYRAEEGN